MGGAVAANVLGLAKSYAQLARLPQDVAERAAPLLNARLAAGFAGGTDPYGGGWAPLAPRTLLRHGPPPLTHTGALRGSAQFAPMTNGWRLESVPFYAEFHMSGTKRMPKRRWLPDSGLPATWREDIQLTMTQVALEKMGKA